MTEAHESVERLWDKGSASVVREGLRGNPISLSRIELTHNGLVASASLPSDNTASLVWQARPYSHVLVYYPHPRHAGLFEQSGAKRRSFGPSDAFPGSVGALHYMDVKGSIVVHWIQGSFKQGEPKGLTRGIASKYGGWKKHLLEEMFRRAERTGAGQIRFEANAEKQRPSLELFEKLSLERGWVVTKRRTNEENLLSVTARR